MFEDMPQPPVQHAPAQRSSSLEQADSDSLSLETLDAMAAKTLTKRTRSRLSLGRTEKENMWLAQVAAEKARSELKATGGLQRDLPP